MLFPYTVIDLTHALEAKSSSWDGGCGFKINIDVDYDDENQSVPFRIQSVSMNAGMGTHIDAPAHCIQHAQTVDNIGIEHLVVPVIRIDVSKKSFPHYLFSPQDVIEFEYVYGKIARGCFVVVHTGWSSFWDRPKRYHNNYKFPSISADAARLLISRNIVGLGIDTLSPDTVSSGFPVHQIVLGAGAYIVENIAHANKLPDTGAFICVMPLKGKGFTESPARVVGLVKI